MTPFDPRGKTNRALLVGVSEYDLTGPPHGVSGDLPAVKHNLKRMDETLARGLVFRQEEITVVHSPSLDEFGRRLRTAAEEAHGLLLLYFAGHGAIPSAGDELFLQMRNASVVAGGHAVFPGAEMFSTLLVVLATSPAQRIVVVLDCCFAGNAARIWESSDAKRDVLLLMSVQANHRIDAGDPATPTPYTEALAQLLDEGGDTSVRTLADLLRKRMEANGHHCTERREPWEPQLRANSEVDVLLTAKTPPGPPEPPEPSPGRLAVSLEWVRTHVTRMGDALRRIPIPIVLALAVAGLVGPAALLVQHVGGDEAACAPPLELRVLTDPDLEPTIRAAADAYLVSDENTTGDGCRRTGVTVYSAGSSDVVAALRAQSGLWRQPRDEGTNPQRDIGPQPDVWIPASPADALWVENEQDTDAVARLEPDEEPFAYSPVVLAVPQNLGSEDVAVRTGHSLNELIDLLTKQYEDAVVRRPDPEFTDVGLLATIGLYGTDTRAVARGERRVGQAGPPSPTAAELLCTLPDDDLVDDRTAALVPEFLLRSGVGCDPTTRASRYAHYPDDVPGVEPVFVRVGWQGAHRDKDVRDASAERFRDWLTGKDAEEVFSRAGFRSARTRDPLDGRTPVKGALADPSPLKRSAGRDAMKEALLAYQAAGGPGQVLFLLDSSGSMARLWEGPSGAPGLLRQSLGGLGEQDKYGVWAVADTGDGPYTPLLSLGPHRRVDAEHALGTARVRDAEADPYAALLTALGEMEDRKDDRQPRLIVHLTDGEDNDRLTGDYLKAVLARAETAGVPVTAVSLESGGCDRGRPDRRIADASGGRCLDTGDDLGAALHDEVARTGTGKD